MFEFKGDWKFELILEEFKIFKTHQHASSTDQACHGVFTIEIFDEFNSNPDPEEYQLNSINYLLNQENQVNILSNLLNYSKEVIYPHYKTFMSENEYPECFPKLKNIEDLNKLFAISSITIKRIGHMGHAYYILNCGSCLDHEHGITVTLHKDLVIDHGEEWRDEKVCEHKGIEYKTYYDKRIKDFNNQEAILTKPHPKYGKLKPWQFERNDFYSSALFRENRLTDLITVIENGTIPKEPTVSRLLPFSISHDKEKFTQYFIEQKPNNKYNAFRKALEKDRFDITDELLSQGYNINEKVAYISHISDTIGFIIKATQENKNINAYKKRMIYLLRNGADPFLEDNYKRNSFYRIERIQNDIQKSKVKRIVNQIIKRKNGIQSIIQYLLKTIKTVTNK